MASGRLPPETIRRIVRLNMGRMRGCYQAERVRHPTAGGRVVATFLIGRDGSPKRVAMDGAMSAELGACLGAAFGAIRFPEPPDGTVRVVYPLLLDPPI